MRRPVSTAIGVLLAAAALFLFILWPREPSFQGRSLSAWLAALDDGQGGRGMIWSTEPPTVPTREQLEASQAIREMGSKALPELLRMLQSKEPILYSMKEAVRGWLIRGGYVRAPHFYEMQTPAAVIHHQAALGLIALESSAKPKPSQLLPLFNNAEFGKETALVLASMAPQGVSAFSRRSSSTHFHGKRHAQSGLWGTLRQMVRPLCH